MTAPAANASAMLAAGALVAPSGMTLYTFDKDVANSGKSNRNGPCTALWPPMMATANDQPAGAYSIIVTRDDGSRQWAYKGKPVYTYKADQNAGDHRRQLQGPVARHRGVIQSVTGIPVADRQCTTTRPC